MNIKGEDGEKEKLLFGEVCTNELISEGNKRIQGYKEVKRSNNKNRCSTCNYRKKRIFGINSLFNASHFYFCEIGGFRLIAMRERLCNKIFPKFKKRKRNVCKE